MTPSRLQCQLVDARDVRMVERREGFGFTMQPRDALGVERERLRQRLDGDVALQLRVPRAIDAPHAPLTDEGRDLVRAELRAGCDGHQRR